MPKVQMITPCLWFDDEAEEAVAFYTKVFKKSKVGQMSRYGEVGREMHHKAPGTVMTIEFELDGQAFTALNGGPDFKFNEAISFQVHCDDQAEIDYFWEKLGEGGDENAQMCGWLKDRFGVSWQVVPRELGKMMSDRDAKKTGRVMEALLKMKKLDLAALKNAYAG